jgi:predicted dehydrogenase
MKVIHVGVGGFGTSWRPALTTIPGVEVVALVDTNPSNLAEAKSFFGLSDSACFASDALPWETVDADAMVHSTPQNFRHAHVIRALRAGKHVVSVKPMSDAWETGLDMVREAERCDRKSMIAHQMRWHPLILKLRELVQDGALGKVGYVHLDFFYGRGGYTGSYPQPYPLLVQGSIHHFDFLRWVLDADASRVWATNFNPPWIETTEIKSAYVAVEMANGVKACYRSVPTRSDQCSWLCEWRIEGTDGIAEVKRNRVYLNGEEILSAWEDGEAFNNRRLPALQRVVMQTFIDYVNGGPEPGISGRNNLNSLETSFGAIRSCETGQRHDLTTGRVRAS